MSEPRLRVEARLRRLFAAAGVRGWLHACDVDDPARVVELDGGLAVPLASTFKLHVAVAVLRAIDAGELEARETLRIGTRRTAGPTGLAAMRDPVRMSVRDLLYLMLAVSDNAACDALYDRVGAGAVDAAVAALGLRSTVVRGCCRDLTRSLHEDTGAADPGEVFARLREPGALDRLAVLDPDRTSRSTPREMTTLLGAVWRDEAASPESCAELRRLMGMQVWPHRLSAGFPDDDVAVCGKTGTLPGLRIEVGVVETGDGRRTAVAVFTRSTSSRLNLPQADAAIGTAARLAVDALA
jgi:beta-lactamase class A